MIILLKQTKTNFNLEYTFTVDNSVVATLYSPFTNQYFKGILQGIDEPITLSLDFHNTFKGETKEEQMGYKLYTNGFQNGRIISKIEKTGKGFFSGYAYSQLMLNAEIFNGYEVGFGNKGLYFCIYRNNQLIAIAQKELNTINYKDKYTIYLTDSTYLKAVFLFLIHYDLSRFSDIMKISLLSINRMIINTKQRELISKYDPTFISRIVALEKK